MSYRISYRPTRSKISIKQPDRLKVRFVPLGFRAAVSYLLDTPANNSVGEITLIVAAGNTVIDRIRFVGTGTANVYSNGSAIIISASSTTNVDGGEEI